MENGMEEALFSLEGRTETLCNFGLGEQCKVYLFKTCMGSKEKKTEA